MTSVLCTVLSDKIMHYCLHELASIFLVIRRYLQFFVDVFFSIQVLQSQVQTLTDSRFGCAQNSQTSLSTERSDKQLNVINIS